MNPLVIKYLPHVVILGLTAWGGYVAYNVAYDAGYNTAKISAIEANKERDDEILAKFKELRTKAREANKELNKERNKRKVVERVIEKEVIKVVKSVEFRCPVPDSGVQLVNKARGYSGETADSIAPTTRVPAPGETP